MSCHCHMKQTETSWAVQLRLGSQRRDRVQYRDAQRPSWLSLVWPWPSIPGNNAHRTSHEEPIKMNEKQCQGVTSLRWYNNFLAVWTDNIMRNKSHETGKDLEAKQDVSNFTGLFLEKGWVTNVCWGNHSNNDQHAVVPRDAACFPILSVLKPTKTTNTGHVMDVQSDVPRDCRTL